MKVKERKGNKGFGEKRKRWLRREKEMEEIKMK